MNRDDINKKILCLCHAIPLPYDTGHKTHAALMISTNGYEKYRIEMVINPDGDDTYKLNPIFTEEFHTADNLCQLLDYAIEAIKIHTKVMAEFHMMAIFGRPEVPFSKIFTE